MRFFSFVAFVSLAAVVLLSAPEVRANGSDTFTFSEPLGSTSTISYVWQLDASPTPDASSSLGFTFLNDVTVSSFVDGQPQTATTDTMLFYASGEGFSLFDSNSLFALIWTDASTQMSGQLYSDLGTGPTFLTGTFSGTDPLNGFESATLTISTPEPSSLLMLFAGFLALAGALALQKVQA